MKRRINIIAVSLIIFLAIELIIVTSIQAEQITKTNNRQILIVDKNGVGDYKTIQEAIENAQLDDTVYVKRRI
jgi:predicted RND superfamily exporter protein